MKTIKLGPYELCYESDEAFSWVLCHGENYESHVTKELRLRLPNSRGFLDVGCNAGIYTVLVKWWMGLAFPTVSVDVNPINCALLLKTIERNGFWNSIVLPVAAANINGTLYGNNFWNSAVSFTRLNEDWKYQYPAMRLGDVPIWPIDTIKIDVEGFELHALLGMESQLVKDHPTIFFEYNVHCLNLSHTDPLDLLNFMLEHQYKLTVLDYKAGMRKTFTEAAACIDHIAKFSEICDIMAEPN